MFLIVFCLIYILQTHNISTGFQDTNQSVNFGFANMSSDSPATAIEQLLPKAKISGPAYDKLDNFSKDTLI